MHWRLATIVMALVVSQATSLSADDASLPEVMPEMGSVPEGRVLVTFSEGLPAHERWLNEGEAWPEETARWLGDEFLLPRIPLRYDAWGIRSSWKSPLLVRMAADVELPAGKLQFLLRARGLSRLWVDGVAVARTEADTKQPPDGEEPMTPVAEPPLPGLRTHGYHMQEVFAVLAEADEDQLRRRRVVLELIVGGKAKVSVPKRAKSVSRCRPKTGSRM